ncbi:uncharacterized protein L199_008101 [Kwoniella botswanensis]|uniref:uncharacterized protein n=1 Tax=Kwoniella botswanensis TaxID=1268659 RepID=UPI00315D9BE7
MSFPFFLCSSIFTLSYIVYTILSPRFDTERKKAYILSSISSCTMTILSLPFFLSYLTNGLKETFEAGQEGWMGQMGWFGSVFFGVYLFVGLLTGWIHHTVYIGLMFYVVQARITPIFLMGAVMELPTFDLAISNLFPSARNDLRFLSSFFIFRILFHSIYLIDCARPSSRAFMGNSWVPTVMLGLALIMHLSWFKGGVTGYIKRQKKSSHNRAIMVDKDPIIEMISTVDSTISSEVLPHSSSPNESPLVTPHTASPSQIPLFLSNLNIPTINLPTGIIDLRSLKENGSGFREAVRSRWDEQKEKFTMGRLVRRKLSEREEEGRVVVREVVEVDE